MHQVLQDQEEKQVNQDPVDYWVNKENKEDLGHKVQLVTVEIKGHVELLVNRVLLDHQEKVVTMADQDLQGHQVNQDNVDKLVYQETLVSQDTQE